MINTYTRQLKNLEYSFKQVVVSGLRGYKNKVERRSIQGENFYRLGKVTLKARTRKKLTEKNTSFKNKKRKEIGKLSKKGNKKGRKDKI